MCQSARQLAPVVVTTHGAGTAAWRSAARRAVRGGEVPGSSTGVLQGAHLTRWWRRDLTMVATWHEGGGDRADGGG
jgi:hypothetical protein